MNPIPRILRAVHYGLLGVAAGLAALAPALADDTDIYLRPLQVGVNVKPQLLIIFGNSASLDHTSVVGAEKYNDGTKYEGGEFDATKLYWCVDNPDPSIPDKYRCLPSDPGDLDPVKRLPVPVGHEQLFAATANHCQASLPSLTASGLYQSQTAASYLNDVASGNKGEFRKLTTLADAGDEIVWFECAEDSIPNATGQIVTEPGQAAYAVKGQAANNEKYTSTAAKGLTSPSEWNTNFTDAQVTIYRGNYLNFLQTLDPLASIVPRTKIAVDALKSLITLIGNTMDVGLMVFNKNWDGVGMPDTPPHGGRVVMKIAEQTPSRITQMNLLLDSLSGHPTNPAPGWIIDPPHAGDVSEPDPFESDVHAVNPAPLAETYWEALNYIRGASVDYGDDDNDSEDSLGDLATAKYIAPQDLSRPVRDISAEKVDEEGAPVVDETGNPVYVSPFSIQCQQVYVLYVTDGVFKQGSDTDANEKFLDFLGGLPEEVSENPDGLDENGSALDEMAKVAFHNDIYDDIDGIQRVTTYTVGVDVTPESPEELLLKKVASDGAGIYRSAKDTIGLVNRLRFAVADIRATVRSFAAPTLSVNAFNKLFNRDEVYFAIFEPDTNHQRWRGNVKKYAVCNSEQAANGSCEFGEVVYCPGRTPNCPNPKPAIDPQTLRIIDTAQSFWSSGDADGGNVALGGAGQVLQGLINNNARRMFTMFADYASESYPITLDTTAHKILPTSGGLYAAVTGATPDLNLLDSDSATSLATTTEAAQVVAWMYGQDAFDEDQDGNLTEARWPFADPLHSRPVAVTFGAVPCTSSNVADPEHPCFGRDLNDTSIEHPNPDKPVIKLFVATNDGVIRMLNDANGKEEWAFVPQEMLGMQYELALNPPGPDNQHRYGVDGTPTIQFNDVNNDGVIDPSAGDFVRMFIGMRRGGRNIYAFDVTPASKLEDPQATNTITPKLLWVLRGGEAPYTRLGQTWSPPQVADIRLCFDTTNCKVSGETKKTVIILGGGYGDNQDNTIYRDTALKDNYGNAIYIIDPDPDDVDENGQPSQLAFIGPSDGDADNTNDPDLTLDFMQFSIPMPLSLLDGNRDGEIDRIYFADTSGQLARIDLGPDLKGDQTDIVEPTGAVLADLACPDGAGSRPDCAETETDPANYQFVQDRRKFMHQVDVAHVRDTEFSVAESYDIVVLASGDRADPNDRFTEGRLVLGEANELVPAGVEAVNNRIYAIRDYLWDDVIDASASNYPLCVDSSDQTVKNCDAIAGHDDVITEADLEDVSDDQDEADLRTDLQNSTGWRFDLREDTLQDVAELPGDENSKWIGEKGLALPVIFDDVIFQTTYVPANDVTATKTCAATEGLGKLYALNLLTAEAAFDFDTSVSGFEESLEVGGGIPSELVVVIREGGVTGLVGVSGGTRVVNVSDTTPRGRSYWFQR